MDILGVGPLELLFILLIALIVLGPNDMVKAGRTLGRMLRKLITSPTWQMIQQTSRDLRYLPNKLIRDAGLEEIQEDLKNTGLDDLREELKQTGLDDISKELKKTGEDLSAWTTPPSIAPPSQETPTDSTSAEDAPPMIDPQAADLDNGKSPDEETQTIQPIEDTENS
jgi:sec-independent protein translocase protein TatB